MNKDGQTQAFLLSVGGMLGVGERYIAVLPSAVKVSYSDSGKAWYARDTLKIAVAFSLNQIRYNCRKCYNSGNDKSVLPDHNQRQAALSVGNIIQNERGSCRDCEGREQAHRSVGRSLHE